MAEKTIQELTYSRWGQLKSERATWWKHWMEITTYLLPRNGRYFVQDRNKGWKRNQNILDSTATKALNTLAAGMMAGMTSPARPWFRLSVRDPNLAKDNAVKEWLQQVTDLILGIFSRGNTYRTLHTIYKELGTFGTAATVLLDDYTDVVRQYPLTAGEYCISDNWRGDICTLYREFEKPVASVVKEFGINNVTQSTRSMYESGTLDAWVRIVHAIEPRADRDPRRKDSLNMPWRSVYFELGQDNKKVLREGGFKYFPALCPRWDVIGGDIYGNSPGMEALGDIKSLQQEQLRKAQGIDYQTRPPLQLPSSAKNQETNVMPGGVMYIDGAQAPTARNLFQVQLDLQALLLDIQDVRQRINSAFFADLFLMLSNQSDARMTATEVAERHEEKLLMLGPVLERLNDELLSPLVEMTFMRALEAGIVPPAPPQLHGQDLQIEFVSMLAQAQRAVATNSIDRFVGSLGTIAQFKPDVLDKFDQDEWADQYSDMLGVDPQLIVPSDKVALIRKQRAQQQAQAQQAALAQSQAQTAQTLANAPTQGGNSNALQDVMSNLTGYSQGV